MLNDEICQLRDELNDSFLGKQDYNDIYKLSIELDELIIKYYNKELIKTKETRKTQNRKKLLCYK